MSTQMKLDDESVNLEYLFLEYLSGLRKFLIKKQVDYHQMFTTFDLEELLKKAGSSLENFKKSLIQLYLFAAPFYAETIGIGTEKKMEDLKDFLSANLKENFSLDQFASTYCLSKEYLCQQFKNCYGVGIIEMHTNLKMDKALNLIKDTNLRIKDIAEYLGYKDLSYFYRVFKKHYNKAPGQIR